MNKDRSLTKNQINFETCHDPHTNSDSDESMSVVNVNDVRATIEELSRVVKEAKQCVKIHEGQGGIADEYIAIEKQEIEDGVDHSQCTDVLTMHMAKSSHLPQLGSKQVGDFYSYSSITQYVHGVTSN